MGESKSVARWTPYEVTLRAAEGGWRRYWDTELWVHFEGPGGTAFRVAGFWDGARRWRVRFAPPEPGRWRWRSESTDPQMDALEGAFECVERRSRIPVRRHGPLRVSQDSRYLVHADGTPFFWLADTGWCLLQQLTVAEARTYAAVRAEQGFSAVQVVAIFARRWEGSGRELRRGCLLPNARGQQACRVTERGLVPNPAFFRHVDALLRELQKAGLLIALLPHWGFLAEPYLVLHHVRGFFQPGDIPLFYPEDGARYARYIGARYGAMLPVWVLGGDVRVETDRQQAYWRGLARALREGAGVDLVRTYHPCGHRSSSHWLHQEPWLDFNMVQSGHCFDSPDVCGLISEDYRRRPTKPVINGEPCYENISHRLRRTDAVPIDEHQVRKAFFWSVFSGAVSGHTYGANNGFQFAEGGTYFGLEVADWLTNVRTYPGGIQLGRIARFWRGLPWWRLRPAPHLAGGEANPRDGARVVAARTTEGDLTAVYIPRPADYHPDLSGLASTARAYWLNPRSGALEEAKSLRAPSDEDWLFLASKDGLL